MDKVTVIMNTLNEDKKYLTEAIESYINQEGVELQFIVSTVEGDHSIKYIKKNFPSIELVITKRSEHPVSGNEMIPKGAYIQLNNALQCVKGEFVCYASSNDRALQGKLLQEVTLMKAYKKDVCYSNYSMIRSDGSFIKVMKFPSYNHKLHLQGNFVSDCSMFRSYLIKEFLPFKLELKNLCYWDFWLRLHKAKGNVFIHNINPTWEYRQHETSMRLKRIADPEKQKQEMKERQELISKFR
jgi:glycosyltransferase involved in cell wall biosynthesis